MLKEVAEALRAGRDFRRPLAPKEPQEEDPAPPPPPAVEGEEGEITAGDGDGGRGGKAGPDEEVLEMTSSLTLPDVVSFFADDPRMVGAGEDTLKRLWDEIVAPGAWGGVAWGCEGWKVGGVDVRCADNRPPVGFPQPCSTLARRRRRARPPSALRSWGC